MGSNLRPSNPGQNDFIERAKGMYGPWPPTLCDLIQTGETTKMPWEPGHGCASLRVGKASPTGHYLA